ncbi:MAG: SRPBCC domain-containing protein [Acidiferrobacterales bacterium]|nr:SRPBCC domain-containing protein [Acidiferrobacterales bacterium]
MNKISATARMVVHATPQAIFDAFVDADTMSKFWFTRRDTGLNEGGTVLWYIGVDEDAYAIEVRVKKLSRPGKIHIEWGEGDQFTEVCWLIEGSCDGHSKLTIEEVGFTGSADEIVTKALDSTKGFNQVIVALKALLEHGAQINVVADHA